MQSFKYKCPKTKKIAFQLLFSAWLEHTILKDYINNYLTVIAGQM